MTDPQMVYESLLDCEDGWQDIKENGSVVGVTRSFETVYGAGAVGVGFTDGGCLEYTVQIWLNENGWESDALDEIAVQLNAMQVGPMAPTLRWVPLVGEGWEGVLLIPGTREFWASVPTLELLNNVLHTTRIMEDHAKLVADLLGDCLRQCLQHPESAARFFEISLETLCGPLLSMPTEGSA